MRTNNSKIFLFVIFLLKINICHGQDQKMFEMVYPESEIISINEKYSKSEIIHPFKQKEPLFALSINAKVSLNSFKSLIRVILIGESGDEYLVLESYYMISEQNQMEYIDYGEETALLNGIVPGSIKIEIEDASILLETVSYNNAETNKSDDEDFTFRSKKIKFDQDIVKIDRLNKQIKKNGYLWTAGETTVSLLTYQQKKQLFGGTLPNLHGFEYYTGGVFNFTDTKRYKKGSSGDIVSSFDWRNRHGQNWITSIKNQGSEPSCWAHGTMASIEAIINLFYNQHINKDLSEQAFVSCMRGIYRDFPIPGWPDPPLPQCSLNSPTNVLCYVKNLGAVDENCYPYSNVYDAFGLDTNNQACTTVPPNSCSICGNLCPDYLQRLWKIADFKELDPPNYYSPENSWCELITEDSLKVDIIRNGPVAFSYIDWGHVMCFVGWAERGVLDNVSSDYDPGRIYWIAKNSWGSGWGEEGYVKLFLDLDTDVLASVVKTPITQPVSTNFRVVCADSDGDGYCWWGIGKRPSNGCPVTSHKEEDGDDSNPLLGPYDENFNCTVIKDCPSVPLVGTINQPSCTNATGSVVLGNLPASGNWILTKKPEGPTTTGSGTNITISGLATGTYSFTVTNASGCTSEPSANVVINAKPIIPTIATSPVIDATLTTASGGGNVTSDGGSAITERGVCWSTTTNPTILNSKTSDGTSIGSFTSTITNLTDGVTYHIRAFATNCTGTGYGSDISYKHNSTGIEDIQNREISVFPNPVKGMLFIEYKNMNYVTINILNAKGVLMTKEKAVFPIQQFDFSKYEHGLYILEFVRHNGETKRIKLIKP